MKTDARKLSGIVLVLAAALVGALISGCGGGGESSGTATSPSVGSGGSGPARPSSLLPADIRESGVIKIGGYLAFPPWEFEEDGEVVGFEPEIWAAVAEELGVKTEWDNGAFEGLLPGLEAERYDMVSAGYSDNAEREESYDWLDYLKDESIFVVAAGNPEGIETSADLCGKTIAGDVGGSSQDEYAKELAAECGAEGEQTEVLQVKQETQGLLAVQQGRLDAYALQAQGAAYFLAQQPETFELAEGTSFNETVLGAPFRKDDPQLLKAMQKGLQKVIESPRYAEILKKWDISDLAVTKATVNLGGKLEGGR